MATQGVPTWSTTAATNSTADPAINMAEGMAPSALNDGVRALMASVAKLRDDLFGSTSGLTTGGSATAFTVTTNSTFATAAAMSGCVFTIIPHATSGASPTLAVDGLTARAINQSTGVAVSAGALVVGNPYLVKYIHGTTEFIIYGAASSVPAGAVISHAGASTPSGWLACNGASLLRTDYAGLFAAIGTAHGAADGTHFSLPDITGRTVAGKESSATRLTSAVSGVDGGTLGAVGGAQSHTLTEAQLASHTHTTTVGVESANHSHTGTTLGVSADHTHTYSGTTSGVSATHTHTESGASGATLGTVAGGGGAYANQALQTGVESADHTHTYSGTSTGISADHNHTFTSNGVSVNHNHVVTNATTGSGTAHNNVQPTIVLNYIIKT